MSGTQSVILRGAEAADAAAVAALHAASWRAHYRGALSDAYLDGPIFEERRAVWSERLTRPKPNQRVQVAVASDELVGFVCLFLDEHPRHGTLVDNLHVTVAAKGQGVGARLMQAAGSVARDALPGRPVHLYVLETNTAAQRFYDRIGGTAIEREWHTEPDGSSNPVLRYMWASPDALVAATSR